MDWFSIANLYNFSAIAYPLRNNLENKMGTHPAFAQKVIQENGLTFWTETFGSPDDPAILLIMGSGAQGLLWQQKFCEQLANKGFFVIRYDNRDVGLSSTVDFEKTPYTMLDMAKDGIALLDAYQLKTAHIVGASLGGVIAMLMASHFPDRVASVTLMMTTTDLRPAEAALNGRTSNSPLSRPTEEYLTWVKSYITHTPKTLSDQVHKFLVGARIIAGPQVVLDENLYNQLGLQGFIRMRQPANMFNHMKAMGASHDLHKESLSRIKAPTLIIHGDQDPILPPDHAESLRQALPHAEYLLIQGMGHALHAKFYDEIITKMDALIKVND